MVESKWKQDVEKLPEVVSEKAEFISTEDIQDLIDAYQKEQEKRVHDIEKPTLLFVGDSGVGKSSCIAAMLNLDEMKDVDTLRRMNISHNGKEGTGDDPVHVNGTFLRCVDVRGKRRVELDQDYWKFIHQELNDRIDLIVGVVKAEAPRDDDISALMQSLRIICEQMDKPFYILMNGKDQIGSHKRYKERENRLLEMSKHIKAKHSWYSIRENHQLGQGVFTVSARPTSKLPNQDCPKSPQDDPFTRPHCTKFMLPNIRYCFDCNTAEVADSPPDVESQSKLIMKEFEQRNVTITYVRNPPHGFGPDDDCIKAAVDILEDLAGAAVIRSATKTIKEFIETGARTIIESHARGVYRLRTAQQRDRSMCAALVFALGLPLTSVTQGSFEESRWVKVQEEYKIRGLWRWFISDEVVTNYLISWGIHYTRKFYAVKQVIAHGFANNHSNQDVVTKCKTVLEEYCDAKQSEIFEYIMNSGVALAYEYFLCI